MLTLLCALVVGFSQGPGFDLLKVVRMPLTPRALIRDTEHARWVCWAGVDSRFTAIYQVDLRAGTAKEVRRLQNGDHESGYISVRPPGVGYMDRYFERPYRHERSYFDLDTGKVFCLLSGPGSAPNAGSPIPDVLNPSAFPGPQLPTGEAYSLADGGRAFLVWDTAERRLALTGRYHDPQTLVEYRPGTWEPMRSAPSIDGSIIGNPDTGPFAVQRIWPWQGNASTAVFYTKDLRALRGGFDWVSDVAPWGALASKSANPNVEGTNNHEAVGLLRFDPANAKVEWYRKDIQPPARWVGQDVLVIHENEWLLLSGKTGQTLVRKKMEERSELLMLNDRQMIVGRWRPAQIEVWKIRRNGT